FLYLFLKHNRELIKNLSKPKTYVAKKIFKLKLYLFLYY
ncbi:unnamed protein product, partial [marine sediment metagenome]